jgi:Flp pilus assembly protein TadG
MLHRFLSRLWHDRRGSSLIELSFILPVLIMLACGAIDLATCYARQLQVQQAAARTMEFAIASGYNSLTTSSLATEATSAAGTGVNVAATGDIWLECDGVRQAGTTTSCTGSAVPARYAAVTITDTYQWMYEQLVPSWNNQPYSVNLRGYAEVRIQ